MSRQKSTKRKKLYSQIALILIVGVLATVGYVFYQFQSGVSMAEEIEGDPQEYEFNGVKNLDTVNVLLLGVDARADEERSRTDSIMVAQYNPKEGTAKIISIMRDIYTEIPGFRNYKMNTAFFLGGPELLRETLKVNFDLDIEYYALIDFTGFENMVDVLAPNGIEIDVEKAMSANIGVSLEPGLQNLNGQELLGYARFRKDAEADFGRVRRQQQVISAMRDELLSTRGVVKLPKMVGAVKPFVQTNLEAGDMLNIVKSIALQRPETVESLTIPVEGSYTDDWYEGVGLALTIDFDKNKQAIEEFLTGNWPLHETGEDTSVE